MSRQQTTFPDTTVHNPQYGITKREYFAAMAMQGILSCPNASYRINDCVRMADALIEELNKTNKEPLHE